MTLKKGNEVQILQEVTSWIPMTASSTPSTFRWC